MSIKEFWGKNVIVGDYHIGPKHGRVLLMFHDGYGVGVHISLKKVYEEYIKSMYEGTM